LHAEITEQPEVLARLLEREASRAEALARQVRSRQLDLVVIAARGTSDHAALYLRYLLEILAGVPVSLAAPSVFTLYHGTPNLRRAMVVAISQSGASEDILAVVEEGRRQNAVTVAMTNEPDSPLARLADWTLYCHAGSERSIPATKTYLAELGQAALLTGALAELPELTRALRQLPADLERVLQREDALATAAARHADMDQCVVLGRGYNYATASEAALKLKEMAYVPAQPYAVPDFLHGPIVVVEEGYPVLLVAPADRTLPNLRLVAQTSRDKGGTVIALTDDAELAHLAHTAVAMPVDRHEALSPLPYAIAGQLFAYHLPPAKGIDNSLPRGLNNVTCTR
jgi:glucosamine--fructose-6-phosphate aminotransferase (isomerizing)